MAQWYVNRGGKQGGPYSSQQLKAMADGRQLQPTDLVWRKEMAEWKAASSIKGLFAEPVAAPAPRVLPPPIPPSHALRTSAGPRGRGLRRLVYPVVGLGLLGCALLVAGAVWWLLPTKPMKGFKYLPNDCRIVTAVKVTDLFRDGVIQRFLDGQPPEQVKRLANEQEFDDEMQGLLGIAPSNMDTVVVGDNGVSGAAFFVVLTKQPITSGDIRSKKKIEFVERVLPHNEVHVGAYTIYEESYLVNDGKKPAPRTGTAFCVAEPNVVLVGRIAVLRAVLERNNNPDLTANMRAAIERADFSNTITAAIDVQALQGQSALKNFSQEVRLNLGLGGDALAAIELATLEAKVKQDRVYTTGQLYCRSDKDAAELKLMGDKGIGFIKTLLNSTTAKLPAKFVDPAHRSLNGVKIEASNKVVKATGDMEVAALLALNWNK